MPKCEIIFERAIRVETLASPSRNRGKSESPLVIFEIISVEFLKEEIISNSILQD